MLSQQFFGLGFKVVFPVTGPRNAPQVFFPILPHTSREEASQTDVRVRDTQLTSQALRPLGAGFQTPVQGQGKEFRARGAGDWGTWGRRGWGARGLSETPQ